MNLSRCLHVVLLLFVFLTPLRAEEGERNRILGFTIGLGVGMLAPSSADMPTGAAKPAFLTRFDFGITLLGSFGFRAELGYSPYEWSITEEHTVPMSHQLVTIDAFGIIELAEGWRLWPAVGYTLDASVTDMEGTGFISARGVHAELSCGFRLNSITFINLATGYHFTGGFEGVTIKEENGEDIEIGDDPSISYFDLHAGVIFVLN
jgi:hypothetical protein